MNTQAKFLVMLIFCLSSINVIAQPEGDDPVSLVTSTTNNIFTQLDENFEEYEANPGALQDLIRADLMPVLDIPYSARLMLGRAGRGLEKAKVEEFADAMINLLINRYSDGLLQFRSTEPLWVLPQRGDLNEKLTRVRTRVKLPNGGDVPIDYAFHTTPDGWKAFDVVVEGISYVTTFRNQIMPDVQANGIDSVISRLTAGELELAE
jgi:phospholipid transport system substrate-binding protein